MLPSYTLHLQLVVLFIATLVCTCNSSIETICRKEMDNNIRLNITCTCNDNIKDFEVSEEFLYFEDATYVTIHNCKKATLETMDINSSELQQLHLHHIHTVVFNIFLPSSTVSLKIENVGNLTGLHNHSLLHVQYLHNLVIKNTNVQLIDSHTFSDIYVENIYFFNTTFKYLNSGSLNFTGMKDSRKNSVFDIERCTFEKLDLNAISVRWIGTFRILQSDFKGILKENTFKVSSTRTFFRSNTFTCSERKDTCDDIQSDILESFYGLTLNDSHELCNVLHTNYCRSGKAKIMINSLQSCYPKLLKYGVNKICLPPEPDKGYNICLNINLMLVCILVLKIMLL